MEKAVSLKFDKIYTAYIFIHKFILIYPKDLLQCFSCHPEFIQLMLSFVTKTIKSEILLFLYTLYIYKMILNKR